MAVYNTPYKSGTISSFSGTTVTVSGFTPASSDIGRILVINSGSAKLQHREITAVSGQDITIAHAWNTNPFIDPSPNSRATDVNPSNGDTIVVSYNFSDLIATDAQLTLTDENHVLVSGTLEASNGAYIHAKNLHIEWNSNEIDIGSEGGMIFGYYGYVSGEDSYTKDSCNIVDNLNSFGGSSIRKGTLDYGLFDIYGGSYYSGKTTGVFLRCYENTSNPSNNQVRMIGVKQKGNVGGRYDGNRSMLVIDAVGASTTVGVANPLTPVARVELSATGCDQAGYAHLGIAPNGNLVFPRLRDIALKVIRTTSSGSGVYTVRAKKAEIDLIDPFLAVGNASASTTFRYGNFVKPSFVDSSGSTLSGALITRLYDDTGTLANSENVTSGTYTEFFARHTDISLTTTGDKNLSDGTQYAPYTLRGIQYGKQFGLTNISVEDTFEPAIVYLDDANITESNQATVDAYTELETPQKFYDRAVSWLETNITDEQAFLVSRSGQLINAGSYNVEVDSTAASVFDFNGSKITIKATEFIGDITTTGAITLLNGAKIIGTATDSGGTTTTLRYTVAGLVAGSNVRIYNVTDNSEVFVGIVAGTSLDGTYTEGVEISAGDTINVNTVNTNGTTAYYEETSTVIATSTGVNALVSQSLNTIYNDNNIDGSTVTGITLDVPNVEFDLDEADNTISSQEIYAWYMNELMTTDGIRTIYKAIDPKSQYRYCIDPSVVNLKFDNRDLANSLAITDGYFYRLNNTSVIASGSGNIEMIPNESYVANSAEIVSGINSIESKVDIVDNNVDQVLSDTDELQSNLDTMIEDTGGGVFRYTQAALRISNPSGVNGDWSATEREEIRDVLGLTGTKTTASGGQIQDIKSKTDQLNFTGSDVQSVSSNMRGTDGANTVTPDNAGIAANGNAIAALNDFDPASDQVIVATNNDKTGYSLTTADKDDIVDRNWDESYSQHTTAGTFGKLMDLLRKANRAIEGEVTGTSTTTSFTSNITGYVTGAFDSEVLVFVSGTINGEARPILDYDSTNGTFNFEEAWTQAPSSSDEFVILPYHVHAISEIQEGLATRNNQNTINENVKKSSKLIPASGNLPDS